MIGWPAREDQFVLAVDLGTGGPKVGFVSLVGRIAWREHVEVATTFPGGGAALQDAEEWWRVVCEATCRGLSSGAVSPEQVVAVSCTGQWSSTVPVDASGRPVGKCVMWMDSRGARHVRAAVGGPVAGYSPLAAARWIRRSGGAPNLQGADPIGHILHLERDDPGVAAATRWYLEPVDYLTMRFTGEASASPASMLGSWLTDNRHPHSMSYDPTLLKMSGVPAGKLPPLRPTGSVVAEVAPGIASELGLGPHVKVVTGVPDLHSAAVGSGCVLDYETHLAISTTSWISCAVPFKKTDAFHQIASVPGVFPGSYVVVDNQDTSGICLKWLRDSLLDGTAPGGHEESAATYESDEPGRSGPISFDALTDLAATAPPGSGGVVFTPWLMGQRTPVDDQLARGGIHNLSLRTGRRHVVRSVLEGVALNNRWLLDYVERFVKRRLDPIRIVGGGAQSPLWCQIHADVMDRTFERVEEPKHASLRGAGLLGGLALSAVTPDEVHGLVPVDEIFLPEAANRPTYDAIYHEFTRLHGSQKAMFRRLNGRARTGRDGR